ncbi:MAG: hypothetical protein HZC25_12570 [Rhodospirillales bacterium]|nr:hypothetical protein [Rhodospirillales bacterium]
MKRALARTAFLTTLSLVSFPAAAESLSAPDGRHLNPSIATTGLPKHPVHRRWPDAVDPLRHRASKKPFWQAGKEDHVLSHACKIGRFNGIIPLRLYAVFEGKEGRALLTMVPRGRQHDLLTDPDGLARPGETYYFKDDGWANCRVFFEGPLAPRRLKNG